jgi:twinkle protein
LEHGAAEITRRIANAEPFPIEGITTTAETESDIMTLYQIGRQHGASTGWPSLDNLYTIKSGQMTIVTGIPGSGKSEWLDALIVNLARRDGWSFGIFSPENYPVAVHAAKFAEKVVGKPFFQGPSERMTKDELHQFLDWANDQLFFIVPPEPMLDDVLDRARALVFRNGIRGLIIDPWNELDHTRPRELTETEHVSRCLTRIRQFARSNDLHAWVVAHPRIMRRESGKVPVPTPYDISGSAHWFNKADNCITVWRDKEDDAAPVEIHTQKIRFREVGRLGVAFLNYDRVTGNYRDAHRWESAGGRK